MSEQISGGGEKQWRPIAAGDRRVLGVLIEKARTTPDQYPLTLNALCNGCNQKSNRSPLMNLQPAEVEEILDRLRAIGAGAEVFGGGRVPRYRHYAYEWLGLEPSNVGGLAVMAELLLRGAQTMGELRARASRMHPLPDQAALKEVVNDLKARGLVIGLTPEGRGHIVTHNLYLPQELEKVRAKVGSAAPTAPEPAARPAAPAQSAAAATPSQPPIGQPAPAPPAVAIDASLVESLKEEIGRLRATVDELRGDLEELRMEYEQTSDDLRDLRDSLGA